jgi:hypothetical protein
MPPQPGQKENRRQVDSCADVVVRGAASLLSLALLGRSLGIQRRRSRLGGLLVLRHIGGSRWGGADLESPPWVR